MNINTLPTPTDDDERGLGPIAGLVIAVPISLVLWGIGMFILAQFIH